VRLHLEQFKLENLVQSAGKSFIILSARLAEDV